MSLYLDSSAPVKRYVHDRGAALVLGAIGVAAAVGTSVVTGAEAPAALAKAIRTEAATQSEADGALAAFWRRASRGSGRRRGGAHVRTAV